MSTIDQNSVPDTLASKAKDFVCSPAMKAAPLGGENPWSVDTTAILNLPIGPDGRRMVGMWIDPFRIANYKAYGVLPIQSGEWKMLGLESTSPTLDKDGVDGLVYRDSRSVVAAWTTRTRKDEIDNAQKEAALRAMGARTRRHAQEVEQMDAYGAQHGIQHFTEDRFGSAGEIDTDGMIAMPGRGVKVSLSGPKKEGTKVWNDDGGAASSA